MPFIAGAKLASLKRVVLSRTLCPSVTLIPALFKPNLTHQLILDQRELNALGIRTIGRKARSAFILGIDFVLVWHVSRRFRDLILPSGAVGRPLLKVFDGIGPDVSGGHIPFDVVSSRRIAALQRDAARVLLIGATALVPALKRQLDRFRTRAKDIIAVDPLLLAF